MKTVFVSYAHADKLSCGNIVNELQRSLKDDISIWIDDRLVEGDLFRSSLKNKAQSADGYLILVSQKYLKSDFINSYEWPWIKEQHENHNKKLFWLPEDVNPDVNAESSILKYLSERQTAHGTHESFAQLRGKDFKINAYVNNAILGLIDRMRAWANTIDNPNKDGSKAKFEFNDSELQSIRANYLSAIQSLYSHIQTRNLNGRDDNEPIIRLPLDEVYITLQADPTSFQEHSETKTLFLEMAIDEASLEDPKNLQNQLAKIIAERETHAVSQPVARTTDNQLEAVFRRERVLVVLGDPGSGKSVLCRWFALQMAYRISQQNNLDCVDLGPSRLPILLRVSKFAEFLKQKHKTFELWQEAKKQDDSNDVYIFLTEYQDEDFLSFYINNPANEAISEQQKHRALHAISALCQQAIDTQQAILLLDGLDEVIDLNWREGIRDALDHFITQKIIPDASNAQVLSSALAIPGEVGGNQVVVTSRITGYSLAQLKNQRAAHFIIQPLDDDNVTRLCHRVGAVIDADETSPTGIAFLKTLQKPKHRTLDRLKRNPLLLTTLLFYFVAHENTLPATRVELYQKLTLDLVRRWGLTEPDGQDNKHIAASLRNKIGVYLKDAQQQEREEFFLKLLSTVAINIHKNYSSGRITRKNLETMLVKELKGLIGINPLKVESNDFIHDAKQLADLVAERLGVLVELGPNLFGFFHLTFQEYLVGWKLLHLSKTQVSTVQSLLVHFKEHLEDARWREPLLFAFGELAHQNPPKVNGVAVQFLNALADELNKLPLGDDSIFFMADLLDEMDGSQPISNAWQVVLKSLLQGYAKCGLRASTANRQQRFAEKIADLRRRQPDLVNHYCLDLLNTDDRMAAPIAHLFWQRLWLASGVLATFSKRQHLDTVVWGWPMYYALSQSIKANQTLYAEPLEKLSLPAEDNALGIKLYEAGVGALQQQRQLFADKEITEDDLTIAAFPLREFFGLNKSAWTVMASNPNCLRVLAAMLGAVDNLEAIRWTLEYRWIAAFLQGADTLREEQMKANPRMFVPRWGVDDTVYKMAVYLDTNPDGRFKRVVAIPQIDPQFIVTQLPSPIEQVIQRAAFDTQPDKTLTAELDHLARQGDANSMAYAKMGLLLMGVEISEVPTQALIDACYRCMQGLRDAVFRAVSSQAKYWFGFTTNADETADSLPASSLSDGQQAIIFNSVANAAISALDATILMGNGGQNQLAVACCANQWAARFSKQSDDFVYNFAVMLDTQGPAGSGWTSALPLLSRIIDNPNLRYVPTLEPAPYPAFWGIILEEQIIPPDFYQALERLAWVANELHPDFGLGFAELFLKHIPAMGEIGQQKNQLLFLLGFDFPNRETGLQLQQELHLFMKTLKSRYQGIGLSEENHWDLIRNNSKTNDAIMQLELALTEGRISISEKTASYFDALVERLAKISQFDACLLLARSAQYAPLDIAQIWLKQALNKIAHYPDDYAQSEFLARFRQLPDTLFDVALEQQHKVLARQLKSRSPLLAAHALGRVGQYLCQLAFPWNAPDVLGTDPAWVVVVSYAAMADIVTVKSTQQDLSGLWQNLAANPDLSVIEDILSRSGVNGLECTVAAIKAINTLKSRSDLHVARLLTLLTRPSSVAMPLLNDWLTQKDGGVYTQHLKAVAALLLAERNKVLPPELLEPLFWLREYGDDMAATRAEIMLASPYRNAEREQRRFSLTKHGVDIVKQLADLSLVYQKNANKRHLYRCAGLALFDWRFDDAEALQHWCDKAVADSHEEATLLQITDWVDLWSADCQQLLCAWLLSGSGLSAYRRHNVLVVWAARLHYIKNAELDANALASLSLIPENDPIRQLHCFVQADNKHVEYESILTVLARLAAVFYSDVNSFVHEAEQEFKATLRPLFTEGKQSAPDTEVLKTLGNIRYSWLGEFPEDCLPLVFAKLYEPQFTYALMSWLHTVIVHAPFSSNDNTAESLVQQRKLEALLSFAVCFSERNPSTYINYIDRLDDQSHQYQVALARSMYLKTSRRSQMAIVTLISRLKRVDLQLAFEVNGENYTVLDALLYGLHGDGAVQQRVAEVLPKIKSLEGGQVLDKLRQLMIGEQASSTRGSVVLAAAQLLQGLAQSNALSTAERREADLLLRTAASHPQNCRPLYRQIGTGNDSDPVGVHYMGDLAEELATLAMRNRF